MSHFFSLPETIEKSIFNTRSHDDTNSESRGVGSIPVDILDCPKEYIFYMDVPGLSKSDIQVSQEYYFLLALLIEYTLFIGCGVVSEHSCYFWVLCLGDGGGWKYIGDSQ